MNPIDTFLSLFAIAVAAVALTMFCLVRSAGTRQAPSAEEPAVAAPPEPASIGVDTGMAFVLKSGKTLHLHWNDLRDLHRQLDALLGSYEPHRAPAEPMIVHTPYTPVWIDTPPQPNQPTPPKIGPPDIIC